LNKIYILSFISLLTITSCDTIIQQSVCEKTEKNYGTKVDKIASEFNLPPEYLKALIILECSGRKEVSPRFEKGVFNKLKEVRDGKRGHYEGVKQNDINNASDAALKNLASSWGPLQLMGYKCFELGIRVKDLRGEKALYWGIKWINKEYGDFLRKEKYEEAFRIHNTGKPSGKPTHDPNYVKKGLDYIDCFKNY